nr:uncharacterized protein LOC124805802 isoform X1 [Hydra vulgaris]
MDEQKSNYEEMMLADVSNYLSKSVYRHDCTLNDKRTIRRKAKRFRMEDNKLQRKIKKDLWLEVVFSKAQRKQIVNSCHSEPTAGHLGRTRTFYKVAERFYWPGIFKDVENALFMQMGIPKVVTSDQGTEFYNQINRELMSLLNVKHQFTTAYHPQANGLDERFNQTIQLMLVKFCNDRHSTWDTHLDACTFAYNTSRQKSIKYTPFELMFGRKPILPIEFEVAGESPESLLFDFNARPESSQHFMNKIIEERSCILEKAKKNIETAQEKQKLHYNKKHANPFVYAIGSKVLIKDFLRKKRKDGKLDFRWLGPFCILKNLGKGSYLLQEIATLKEKKVNGAHIKPYITCDINVAITEADSFKECSKIDSSHTNPTGNISDQKNKSDIFFTSSIKSTLLPMQSSKSIILPMQSSKFCNNHDHDYCTPAKKKCYETNVSNKDQRIEISTIEVETYKIASKETKKEVLWIKNSLCELTSIERNILRSENEWLTDSIIFASRNILKAQSSIAGFQDPILGLNMAFLAMKNSFIQILHDGYGHWFTISNIGAQKMNEVFIYDSMLNSLSDQGKKQIAALLVCPEKKIIIKIMDVQKQKGGNDCGLFAVAFAAALTKQIQPDHCLFKQNLMRDHLLKSLQETVLSMFPTVKVSTEIGGVSRIEAIDIFCSC